MNEAIKTLNNELAVVDAERSELTKKLISIVQPASEQAETALATVAELEARLRDLRGRRLIGDQVDAEITAAEAELERSRQTAAEHQQIGEAAATARGMLQSQIDALDKQAAVLREQIRLERWRAIRAEVERLADAYEAAIQQTVDAYLRLAGTARLADSLRPTQDAPYSHASTAPAELTVPMPLVLSGPSEFKRYYNLRDQHASAEAEARVMLAALLEE